VLELGQRWGLHFAEDAAVQSLAQEIDVRGPRDVLVELSKQWNLPSYVLPVLDDEINFLWRLTADGLRKPRVTANGIPALQVVITPNAYELLGRPPYATSIRYENPVDVAVSGAGFGFKRIISLLVLIRDWGTAKRQRGAEAAEAEARAEQAISRADLLKWYVNEVQEGRAQLVPAGQLASEAKDSELRAIDRLTQIGIRLELPLGADGRGDN
jgi:hypothetical protein